MKTRLIILLIAIISISAVDARANYNVRAVGYDISDNLDLEAVSYIFGESQDLEDFENRLNDPRAQISNLDLNRDGYVDYLRVVEVRENGFHLVTIQAVLDRNVFQDVATIDVERNNRGGFYVQVVGDPYIYGPNYIVEPAYARIPIIFSWFVRPTYVVWHSPYYWGYYPRRYRPYHCLTTFKYHRYLHSHVDYHVHNYHYSNVRRNPRAVEVQRLVRRNDYGSRHPNSSFSSRNSNYKNKYDMNRSRSVTDKRVGRRSSGQSVSQSGTRSGNVQRNSSANRYNNNKQSTTRSSRSVTTQPAAGQRGSGYNKSSGSRSQSNGSAYSRPQSTKSSATGSSSYQRSNRSSGSNSAYKAPSSRQTQVKSSSSSSGSRSSVYKPAQSRKVESRSKSTKSTGKSTSVRSNSRSSGSSVVRKASSSRSQQKASSGSESRSGRSRGK
ncbi:hypothetical protein [Mangrovibacterium marinum]|uniref:EF-hand domain-containing protein n=1 Tax=Mangrovibacterium marinum TaxID=1639118 RepID=A0A2T5BX31_9BACT|nr:hypothetical protein [Mangrovibacterium marinum]PTN04350.1 hypothetical protein C8N47_13224 [Mangrovibacterium marinum]